MENKDTEKSTIAHANFKKGLTDYNDGAHVTHYHGNDSYDGASIPDELVGEENKLDGYEAQGNDLSEEEDEEDN